MRGVPLWRASMGADTLHPLNAAQGHRWLIGKGVREEFYGPRAHAGREAGVAAEPVVLDDQER